MPCSCRASSASNSSGQTTRSVRSGDWACAGPLTSLRSSARSRKVTRIAGHHAGGRGLPVPTGLVLLRSGLKGGQGGNRPLRKAFAQDLIRQIAAPQPVGVGARHPNRDDRRRCDHLPHTLKGHAHVRCLVGNHPQREDHRVAVLETRIVPQTEMVGIAAGWCEGSLIPTMGIHGGHRDLAVRHQLGPRDRFVRPDRQGDSAARQRLNAAPLVLEFHRFQSRVRGRLTSTRLSTTRGDPQARG